MGTQRSLKTKLTLAIVAAVLVTVALISVLSNYFISRQFNEYVSTQQSEQAHELVDAVASFYLGEDAPPEEEHSDESASTTMGGMGGMHHGRGQARGYGGTQRQAQSRWQMENLRSLGLKALDDGFVLHVSDDDQQTIWDAHTMESSACSAMMGDMSRRMERTSLKNQGFVSTTYPLEKDGQSVGTVEISHYGPYFYSEQDSQFLAALNRVLLGVGALSLGLAVILGVFMARRVARPILHTSQAAQQMAEGNYHTRIQEKTTTRELTQLTQSINELARSLEQQEGLRQELTGNVAHELRTPLTTLSTHVEAMIEGLWEPTPQRLQSVYEELGRLTLLVEDLEDLAQIESRNVVLKKQDTNLWELLNHGVAHYALDLEQKDLTVHKKGAPLTLSVDPDRMQQVINNLLSNAIKYTPQGGNITLTTSHQGESAVLQVQDDGIGIEADELPYIFQRFYRTDKSRHRDTGGAGIGMTVVQSIVSAHGGTLSVASDVGKGSTFTITLPAPS